MISNETTIYTLEKTVLDDAIIAAVDDAIRAAEFLKKPESIRFISLGAEMIASALQQGKKVLIAGNGGSLCDAMHFAEELSGQFRRSRKALAALALADPGHLTCVGNDYGFDYIFSRGVEAHGKEGDVLVALTTSGNSLNIVNAVNTAKEIGMKTICFLGKTGGVLKGQSDLEWVVSGFKFSDRVQEAHMAAIHIMIEMIERILFNVE